MRLTVRRISVGLGCCVYSHGFHSAGGFLPDGEKRAKIAVDYRQTGEYNQDYSPIWRQIKERGCLHIHVQGLHLH